MELINRDETGTRFGYIRADSLHPDLLHYLLYEIGNDLSYAEAEAAELADLNAQADDIEEEARTALAELVSPNSSEYEARLETVDEEAYEKLGYTDREDFIDQRLSHAMDNCYCEEPIIEFECDGVKGRTSYLGGALNLWIFESPVVGKFAEYSPCVPGAGNLDQPDEDGVETYTVPPDWLWNREEN